jgi:endo-1,4-beta-xylanase
MIQDINDRYKRDTGGTRNLIEGVGTQMHIWDLNLNLNNVRQSLRILSTLGIEIAITELDIPGQSWAQTYGWNQTYGYDTDMSERDAMAQALIYARLMQIFKEYSAHITRVSFWGLTDNTSWKSAGNPTLFDWRLNAKPAFHAVSDPDGFLRQHGGRRR